MKPTYIYSWMQDVVLPPAERTGMQSTSQITIFDAILNRGSDVVLCGLLAMQLMYLADFPFCSHATEYAPQKLLQRSSFGASQAPPPYKLACGQWSLVFLEDTATPK